MGPYPRLCLTLLKEAERVNLLHKVRRSAIKIQLPATVRILMIWKSPPPHLSILSHAQARVLLEVEEALVAAAVAHSPPSSLQGEEEEEEKAGAANNTEPLPSLPSVSLRPVPPPASCWCVHVLSDGTEESPR
jgi:hypothetical protein